MTFKRPLHIFHACIYLKPVATQIFVGSFAGKIGDPGRTGEIKHLENEEITFLHRNYNYFGFDVKEDT